MDETLGEADTSQFQADDLGPALPFTGDDLGGPAANVHDDGLAGRSTLAAQNGKEDELGLFLTGQDLDRITDPVGESGRDLGTVPGHAERVGPGDADPACARVLRFVDETLEAFEGAGGGGLVDEARTIDALAQAGNLAHAMRGAQALAIVDVRDEKADRIGADVDGANSQSGVDRTGNGHSPRENGAAAPAGPALVDSYRRGT